MLRTGGPAADAGTEMVSKCRRAGVCERVPHHPYAIDAATLQRAGTDFVGQLTLDVKSLEEDRRRSKKAHT